MSLAIFALFNIVCCIFTFADPSFGDFKDEPNISIVQSAEKGISVIIVQWPDGVTERLEYKNDEVKKGKTGYLHWFNDRQDAYEKRNRMNK